MPIKGIFEVDKLISFKETTSLGTVPSGFAYLGAKDDGKLYFKNDAQSETDLTAAGSGGGEAMFTVAANDSPATLKARADYVCDGTNDGVEINTALALGSVHLLPGTFNIDVSTDPVTIPSNDLTLSGSGKSTVIKYNAGASGFKLIIADTKSGLTLKNFSIDGTGSTSALYGVYFNKVGSGDGESAVRGFHIENLYINGVKQTGIELVGSQNGVIIGCHMLNEYGSISGRYFDGVTARKHADTTPTKGVVITGNVFLNTTACVWIVGGEQIVVSSNYMEGDDTNTNGNMGVEADTSSSKVIVANNYIKNMTDDSIYIYDFCTDFLITGNFCERTTIDHAIFIEECSRFVVDNNTVIDGWRDGITISSCTDCTVRNNFVIGSSQETDNVNNGIGIYASDDTIITGNTVRKGTHTNKPKYGIHISSSSSDRTMVHGNDLYTSGTTGDLHDLGTGTLKRDNKSNTGGWLTDN